jgi:hypothetical protein
MPSKKNPFKQVYLIESHDIPTEIDITNLLLEEYFSVDNGSTYNLEWLPDKLQDIIYSMPQYPGDDKTIYLRVSW